MHETYTAVRMTRTKTEGALEYRFRYHVLYASFERQIKCISNLESALSVTVCRIIVTSNLESEEWTVIVQLMKGSKNKKKQEKNI